MKLNLLLAIVVSDGVGLIFYAGQNIRLLLELL